MDINELLKQFAEIDDMEAADGMNIREAVGDVIDQRQGLNGNTWTRTEEGKFTFEIQGVPVEYMLCKHVETDKDTKDTKTVEYEITLTKEGQNSILDKVQDKIKQEFIEQAKMYGVTVDDIGSTINIGIPCDATYIK